MASKPKPFTDVDFPRQHPVADVADHEVLMAFRGDREAALFLEWWGEKGAAAFGGWLSRREVRRPKTLCEVLGEEED